VRRIQPVLFAWATWGLSAASALQGAPGHARAQDVASVAEVVRGRGRTAAQAPDLAALAIGLASSDARGREAAYAGFAGLDESSLDAIEARIRSLSGRRPAPEAITAALTEIRRATGSRRADDRVDIASGALPALAARHDASMVAACEALLVWRALEKIATPRAFELVADIIALDGGAWETESRRTVERVGVRLGPALVAFRSHPNASVRRWSRWGTAELGFDQPGRVIQLPAIASDTTLLADTLRAWGSVHQLDAMRVVVSFVGHEHEEIRSAARAALDQFGRNAIWIVREQLALVSGQEADPRWGWERTHQALLEAHDEARLAPVRADLARGESAGARGDFESMAADFDRVLLRAPELAQRGHMAAGYARLAALRRSSQDLTGAARALRRAVALSGSNHPSEAWTAEWKAIQADIDLSRGIADLHAYQLRIADADHDGFASNVVASLSGQREAESQQRKRLAAAGAAILCALAAILFLRRRPRPADVSHAESTPIRTEDPGDTSPGSLGAVV